MSIFDLFRKNKADFDTRLFGKWRLQQSQQDLPAAEDAVAEFSPDGALTKQTPIALRPSRPLREIGFKSKDTQ